MNDVSTAELLELRFMLESSIDVQFQAWMAITFAVVVASYSGRADMTKAIRIAIVCIYLMAAYALFGRWITEGLRIGQIAEILRERGVSMPIWMGSGYFRFATYFLGTMIAAISIFYFGSIEKRDEKSTQED
jgi:hypothetical protein